MRTRILATTIAVIALVPAPRPTTDVSLPFIEYRVLKQIGQVRLTAGFVHDPEVQRTMLANLGSLDREGIILVAGDSVREFKRSATIGSHSVETTISIHPPIGHGYRGGLATAEIVAKVDGKNRIDCYYSGGPIELADVGILPLDGMISIAGSYNDKRVGGLIFLNGDETIDATWVERHVK
jgi:hypothetical protein